MDRLGFIAVLLVAGSNIPQTISAWQTGQGAPLAYLVPLLLGIGLLLYRAIKQFDAIYTVLNGFIVFNLILTIGFLL